MQSGIEDMKRLLTTHNWFRLGSALLAVYLIWGSIYFAIRVALESFPPFLMLGIRFLLAGSILYFLLRTRGEKAPSRLQWIRTTLIGGLLLVGGNGGVAYAQQWVSSSLAALGFATVPLWAGLFAGLWGNWPTRLEWMGLGLGFAGVGLLSLESNLWANPAGIGSLLLAVVTFALGSVWSRHLLLPTGLMTSAMQMLSAGGLLLVLSLVFKERMTNLPTVESLWALIYLVVFGSLVAFSAYIYLLNRVRLALATSYTYVNPVIAVVLGVGLAGENITSTGLLAMLVILSGVGLAALRRK
jgi:drug/metabolite transporter (DMT)-like permease